MPTLPRNCFSFLIFPFLLVSASAKEETRNPFQVERLPERAWGSLEYYTLYLEPSDSFVSGMSDFKFWSSGTLWIFPTRDKEELFLIFQNAGLSEEWITRLLVAAKPVPQRPLIEIRPDADIVEGLSPQQRNRLYPHIHTESKETVFSDPYALMPGGIAEAALFPSGLRPELIGLLERLSFPRGRTMRFSDIYHVLGHTHSEEERLRVMKLLLREKAISARLQIHPDSDTLKIAQYWSSGERNKRILPLLESVAATSGVEKIDIAHLLPSLPRRLLNTYPSPEGWRTRDLAPDCFWTSFSFFSESPSARLLENVAQTFEERYERASPPLQLGDLILIRREDDGSWLHACNYIAGGLAFTKNGSSPGRPWAIQRLEDITFRYVEEGKVGISFFRLKPEYLQ